MSTAATEASDWKLPSTRKVAMISLILTESALFTIFLVAYLFYMGKSLNPPYPKDVLHFPLLATIALLGSSVTIFFAEVGLHKNRRGLFHLWWAITIGLGLYFVGFSAWEWHHLIFNENLTLATNVFGTTFYSLVGLHLAHVIVGLCLLGIVLVFSLLGKLDAAHHEHVEMISWYWHFVDAIWVIVAFVVYILSVRS